MKAIKYIFLFILLAVFPVKAQNVMTSSPYSMFGLGEISSGLYGQNAGMGGVSYGMRDASLINIDNPAGLSGLDSCKLVAEVSAFIKQENYRSSGNNNNAFTGNFSGFSLGGRIVPRWYAAASISPYTSVGYYFSATQPMEGTPNTTVTSTFYGEGGLSKASFTNAFRISRKLSAGVNLHYVFGNLSQLESQNTMSVQKKMSGNTFYADFGLQYQQSFARDISLTLGAVYGYKQKLRLDNTITVTTSTSEEEVTKKKLNQYLPQFFGLGGALNYKRWVYALDYSLRQYSVLQTDDSRISFKDSHELRLGVSYNPGIYTSDAYWKRITYKAGINLSTPYLNISNKSGLAYRATAGLALPVLNGLLNTSVFYERLQLENNVFRKGILGFTVSYTLSERFYKVKL